MHSRRLRALYLDTTFSDRFNRVYDDKCGDFLRRPPMSSISSIRSPSFACCWSSFWALFLIFCNAQGPEMNSLPVSVFVSTHNRNIFKVRLNGHLLPSLLLGKIVVKGKSILNKKELHKKCSSMELLPSYQFLPLKTNVNVTLVRFGRVRMLVK